MAGFYDATPEPTAAPVVENPVAISAAVALYGADPQYVDKTVSEEKRAERVESTSRSLYSAQSTFGSVLPDDAADVFADVKAAREVAADYQIEATDATELLSMMRQLPQVTEDDRSKWHADSLALLVPEEGTNTPRVSQADLNRARAFVARDPRVFDLLDRSGLGNHPDVVKRVVHLAREHALRSGK